MNDFPMSSQDSGVRSNGDRAMYVDDRDELISLHQFEKYLDIIRANKVVVAGVLALALALGLAATLLATPQYRATARVEISPAEQNITNVEGLQNETVMTDRAYLPTQYELLESYSLAARVVRELDLSNDEEFLTAFDFEPNPLVDTERAIIAILFDNLSVEPIINSLLVDVSFNSPSPRLSTTIANAWAQGYIEENLERRFGATIEARDFLAERLEQTRQNLEDAERELIAYASAEDLLTVGIETDRNGASEIASQTLVASDLAEFNQLLSAASAERITAEAALAARDGATAAAVADYGSETITNLRTTKAALQTQLAELLSRFGEGYPPVQAARAELAEIEAAISEEEGEALARLRANYREALAREERLQNRVAELRGEFMAQRQDSVQYNILQREVDTNRELYAGLLQRFREIGVVGVGESNILIVDEAIVPNEPYAPSLIQNLLIALVVGLIVVGAGVFLYDVTNQSLRDPRQVKTRLKLPLLASIPRTPEDSIVEDLSHAFSELYESYFSLTSSIAFNAGGDVPASIMVTSSRPGEGKSLSAVALAYLLARQNKRVLLIDCDLRNSGINKYINANAPVGLSQYLQGREDWRSLIEKSDPLEGFDVISAGRRTHSVAELFSKGRLQELLNEAEGDYDHIVLDGPPVLGLADAPMVASSMGGVVFIIEANEGKWRYIEGALSRLAEANAQIIGAAVTKLDTRNQLYGYGQGYGYGYGYGPSEGSDDAKGALS